MAKHKVTIIGAGNVGATTAQRIFDQGYADVVLIDILEGIPQGKSLDILESGPVVGSDSKIIGDNNYESSKNSDVVVITAGIARKPGMSRDDLLLTNMKIVGEVTKNVCNYCKTKWLQHFFDLCSSLINEIQKPTNRLEEIVQRTRDGGAEIVGYLKTGSAYYAPSASIVQMVESILFDKKEILPCAAFLEGEYDINGLFVGVPIKIGKSGVEEIITIELSSSEQKALKNSANSVKELTEIMYKND